MVDNKANICGISTIVIWFTTPLMLALMGSMPPFLIGAVSFLGAFFLAVAWWVYKGEDIRRKFDMSPASYALGFYGIGLYNTVYIYAVKTGPLLEVNLINYLWPAFLIIFGGLLQKTKPDTTALLGIVFCFAGCWFVFKSRGTLSFSGSHLMLLLAALGSLMWASYSALSKYARIGSDQIAVFFLLTGLLMLCLHLLFEKAVWPTAIVGWSALGLYMAGRGAFMLWHYAMKHGQARFLGSLSYFIPLFATLALAAAGFADFTNHSLLTGAVLIISGCIVINFKSLLGGFQSRAGKVAA